MSTIVPNSTNMEAPMQWSSATGITSPLGSTSSIHVGVPAHTVLLSVQDEHQEVVKDSQEDTESSQVSLSIRKWLKILKKPLQLTSLVQWYKEDTLRHLSLARDELPVTGRNVVITTHALTHLEVNAGWTLIRSNREYYICMHRRQIVFWC